MFDDGELIDTERMLAEVTEEIARRLQSGESLEVDAIADQYPHSAGPIRELLPTLNDLVELGRSVALGRRRQTNDSHPFARED